MKTLSSFILSLLIITSCISLISSKKDEEISILGIEPNGGLTSGETRVIVRLKNFNPDLISTYPHPKCRFGSSSFEVSATYVKCAPTPRKVGGLQPTTAEKTDTCIQCEDSLAHEEEIVSFTVSLLGDFTDTLNSVPFRYYPEPKVLWISPRYGPKDGGTRVDVYGKGFLNFDQTLRCGFGAKEVKGTFINENHIQCLSPFSSVVQREIPFSISLNNQQNTREDVPYVYYDNPSVSRIEPSNRGPDTGGTEIHLRGSGFNPFKDLKDINNDNETFCQFSSLATVPAKVISSTEITCISPPSYDLTQTPVEITLNYQQWTDDDVLFYYYHPPYAYYINPKIGPVSGGTEVKVYGGNFEDTGIVRCKFGDKLGEGKFINTNLLTCISPPVEKPIVVPLKVATRENEFSSGLNTIYTYYADPVIHYIEPICGPEDGYTQITVVGENFPVGYSANVKCLFNGEIATDATVMDFNIIKCDSPKITSGEIVNNIYELTLLINEKEKTGPAQKFYYYKNPTITGLGPIMGGVEGDTTVRITGTGFNQPGACNITTRFATYHAKPTFVDNNYLLVKSPEANYTGAVVVQVALNGQQFTQDITFHYRDEQNTFYYYKCPVVAKINPEEGPSVGGNDISVYGIGFLEPYTALSKETQIKTALYDTELPKTIYYRFIDRNDESIIYGDVQTEIIDGGNTQKIELKSPSIVDSPHHQGRDNIRTKLQISYDGEVFCDYDITYTFFNLPNIKSVNPRYAPLAVKNQYTTLTMDNLNCNSADCSKGIKCRFRATEPGSVKEFILDGEYIKQNEVKCPTPNVNIPEEFNVEMSINGGNDFTNNGLTYAYYDPFVLRVEPQMLSTKGGTDLTITGYGFADTGKNVKVMFGDSEADKFNCDGDQCIGEGTQYINSTTIKTKSAPRSDITDKATGNTIDTFKKIPVEVAIYNDDFTDNKVSVFYYQEPRIVNDIYSSKGTPLQLSKSEKDTLNEVLLKSIPTNVDTFIPIPVDGSDLEDHLKDIEKFTNYTCRFDINGKSKITEGVYTRYPLNNTVHNLFLCQSPQFINEVGDCEIHISMNGYDYSDDTYDLELTDPVNIYKIDPPCGPIEGSTPIKIYGTGFQDSNSLVFKWGPQNLVPMSQNSFLDSISDSNTIDELLSLHDFSIKHGDNETDAEEILKSLQDVDIQQITVKAPSAPNDDDQYKTRGGLDYISVSKTNLLPLDDFLQDYYANSYIHTNFEYYYYRQPEIKDFTPSGSISTGGVKVTVIGAWFQNKPEYGLTPYCKFGNHDPTPGEYINTVRVLCTAPPSDEENIRVPLFVSLNGEDFVKAPKDFKYYSDFRNAKFDRMVPISGPSTGGTNVKIYGSGFSTMFDESEFMCQFEPVDTKIVDEDGEIVKKEVKGKMEPRNVPAKLTTTYADDGSTTAEGTFIECATPGGWPGGSKTNVNIAFDGQTFIDTGKDFYFFKVDDVVPCSGPNSGEGELSIVGGGFQDNGEISYKMNGVTYKPLQVTEKKISCDMPEMSGNFTGKVDMSVFLNGKEEIRYDKGFYYYNQPTVESVYPKTGPSRGNPIFKVYGQGFRDDFTCSNVGCRIGSAYGVGKVISDSEMLCSFTNLPVQTGEYYLKNQEGYDEDEEESEERLKGRYMTIALNNVSFTPENEELLINTYSLSEISPVSGPIDAGTTIVVKGSGFTDTDNIRCRFGVPGYYSYTEGTFVDYNRITCPSPVGFELPVGGQLPFTVPFSIAMNEDEFNPWTETAHVFTFYQNPQVEVISPTEEIQANVITPVFLKVKESEDEDEQTHFSMPSASIKEDEYTILDTDGNFQTRVKTSVKYQPITCRFNKYGVTEADYLNRTDVNCLTPNFNDDDMVYEEIPIEIAENGVDYVEAGKIKFQGQQASSVGCMYCVLACFGVLFLAALAALIAWMCSKRMLGIDQDIGNDPHVRNKQLTELIKKAQEQKAREAAGNPGGGTA